VPSDFPLYFICTECHLSLPRIQCKRCKECKLKVLFQRQSRLEHSHLQFTWMNEVFMYLFLCTTVHPKHFTISTLHFTNSLFHCATPVWMKRWQTHQIGGEEREWSGQFSGWGLLGGHDWHRGYTPTLYEKCNDHVESGPRFNISFEGYLWEFIWIPFLPILNSARVHLNPITLYHLLKWTQGQFVWQHPSLEKHFHTNQTLSFLLWKCP